jgi:hypothetical protein
MRRVSLAVTFFLLLGGLVALWHHRFERQAGVPGLNLGDLRSAAPALPSGAVWLERNGKPELRLNVAPGKPRVALRMSLPGFPAMESLHIRFDMAAKDLKLGPQKWDDGRLLIEWRNPDGSGGQETDPVSSVRDRESSNNVSLVVRAASGASVPVLRIEHLGSSGEFTISRLEMIAVRETEIWKSGRWLMLAAWFFWLWAYLTCAERRPPWRKCAAICVCLGMGVYCAIPGPWKTLRPMLMDFKIGKPVGKPFVARNSSQSGGSHDSVQPPPKAFHAAEPMGSIPLQGRWIIQAKLHLSLIRPLLHAMLLFAPALVLAILVGRRKATELSAGLAVAIEAAQIAFGYGFDWVDVMDLVTDFLGIAIAIWVFAKWRAKKSSRSFDGTH